jgi:hypothetical protein
MRRTKTTAVLAMALALFAAGAATGQEQGSAVIFSVDAMRSLVVLDGESYRVDDSTVLEDKDGNALTVGSLPSLEGGSDADASAVWFEAREGGGTPHRLERLRLTGSVPK